MTLLYYFISSVSGFIQAYMELSARTLFFIMVLRGVMMSSGLMLSQRYCSVLGVRKEGPKDRNLQRHNLDFDLEPHLFFLRKKSYALKVIQRDTPIWKQL